MNRLARAAAAVLTLCGAATALAVGPTTAPSSPTSGQDVGAEIQALRARLDQLETQQKESQARVEEANRQKEQAETEAQVQLDATRHEKFLDESGLTAGYENRRFFIGTEDRNFVLRPWFHIQVRDGTAFRQDAKKGNRDEIQNGFEIRRARLGFDGNLFSPDFTYFINWATYRANSNVNVTNSSGAKIGSGAAMGGLPVLEEAWVKYRLPDSPFYLKAGQLHDPLDHENIVGSKYRQPEASLQGDIFGNTDTFTQGATFIFDPQKHLRIEAGVTDGIRAANTNFEDYPNNGIAYDYGFAGRAEYKVFGNWKDYDQLTAYGNRDDLLVFGLASDYSETGHSSSLSTVADVQYALKSGLFFYGCYFGRYTTHNMGIPSGAPTSTSFGTPGTPGLNTYEYSVDAQLGYAINKLEPYVRYEFLHLAGTPAGSNNNVNSFEGGFNYYFNGHNAKFTGQVVYLPKGIPVGDDSQDVLISNNHEEVVFMAQFQLLL